jgi:hypothetical protein
MWVASLSTPRDAVMSFAGAMGDECPVPSLGSMNFDGPSRTPSRVWRLPLRIITTAAIVVALVSISIALARPANGECGVAVGECTVVAGSTVRQLTVVVCGVVGFGLGTLILSVTNQVAIAHEQTAGLVMAVIVFVVVVGMCILAVVLLLAGALVTRW